MHVPLCSPLRGYSGRHKNKSFVLFRRNDRQFLRRHVRPSDPKTSDQLIMRQRWTQAKRNWATGPNESDRQAWKLWAARHLVPAGLSTSVANVAGYNAYMAVELNRMALGMEPGTTPPESGVPGRIILAEQMPADEANTFRFRLMHDHTNLEGARVLVETTPATLRTTRAPREGDLRRAAGMHAESFLELKASGESYELRGGMHFVQTGERYGMRFRIITSEAVAGVSLRVDWTRGAISATLQAKTHGQDAHATKKQRKRGRELDTIQKAQIEAFWNMLEFMHHAPWRPPWMEKKEKKKPSSPHAELIETMIRDGTMT